MKPTDDLLLDRLRPCVVCGALTEWRCADCGISRISEGVSVAVCTSPACRDAHEQLEAATHFPVTTKPEPRL